MASDISLSIGGPWLKNEHVDLLILYTKYILKNSDFLKYIVKLLNSFLTVECIRKLFNQLFVLHC